MRSLLRRQHRWARVVSVAVVLLAMVKLPNIAGTPTVESISNPKIDPFHRLAPQSKTRNPKVYISNEDAWVAKDQVGPDGVRKVLWTRQLGTSSGDVSNGVATDSSGNVFITGDTYGALGGTNQGVLDAWVAKYSPDRILKWTRQLGTSSEDDSYGIATDSSGNVFITGVTYGSLGGTNQGVLDAWVAKYNPHGTQMWIKQLGSSSSDWSYGVATDSSGNVFITGVTRGALGGTSLGGFDAWVAKYSPDGTQMWIKQLGTSSVDVSWGVATDSSGNVFITGDTWGSLGGTKKGRIDAWVAKYGSAGALKWIKQLGTSDYDHSYGVATDRSGNVFITGDTYGALGGTYRGIVDVWAAKFSSHGKQLWLRQDGTPTSDDATGITVDSNGYVITTGSTYGNFSKD